MRSWKRVIALSILVGASCNLILAMPAHAESDRRDEPARERVDVAEAVTQALLLNAVRGTEYVPGAIAKAVFREDPPCDGISPGLHSDATERQAILLFPKTEEDGTVARRYHPEGHLLAAGMHHLPGGSYAEGQDTFSYQIGFEDAISRKYAIGLTYLNEGHIRGSHRDAFAAQGWRRWSSSNGRVRVGAGVGPEMYFNTNRTDDARGYEDDHGIGLLASIAAQVEVGHGVFLEGRANKTLNVSSHDSHSFLVGIGYHLEPRSKHKTYVSDLNKNEFRIYTGNSIVNSFESEQGAATKVEYRRNLSGPFGAVASYLNEGDAKVLVRNGMAVQASLSRNFENDKVELSAAVGPYINREMSALGDRRETRIAGLLSFSAGYRITRRIGVHAAFDRVYTNGSSDTDVFLLGISFR